MKKKDIKTILAIDTSCDETSCAVTHEKRIYSNVISSQTDLHEVWGGVVPDIARRAHQEKIDFVINRAMKLAGKNFGRPITWDDIDAVAVTQGPGLAIALEVGINKAKELSKKFKKPLIAVNHIEGHMLSSTSQNVVGKGGYVFSKKDMPALGVIVSGKHTELVIINDFRKYKIVGETLDDAIGEAYDKVGRMLGLGYPAGPTLSEFAKLGNPDRFPFPVPLEKQPDNPNFSYSGLKTSVYYFIKKKENLSKKDIYDIAASFEKSAITHLQQKIELSIKKYSPKVVLAGGGVASSSRVRQGIRKVAKNFGLEVQFPFSQKLYPDNAAMIGVTAFYKAERGEFVEDMEVLDRSPRLKL